MRYISDKTGKVYETEEKCLAAEKAYDAEQEQKALAKKQKDEARAMRAKEVESAYKAYSDARKAYHDKLEAFTKDYGSFHMTIKNDADNILKTFFDDFWMF